MSKGTPREDAVKYIERTIAEWGYEGSHETLVYHWRKRR